MARSKPRLLLYLLAYLGAIHAPLPSRAAAYPPKFFLLNLHFGYDSVNPTDLNSRVGNLANLSGLITARLRAERGLIYPDWSHWIEAGYVFNEVGTRDIYNGSESDLRQSLSYVSVVPVGVTFWFFKTAFVDFGLGFGLGGALGTQYSSSITRVSNGAIQSSGQFSTVFAPIVDAKIQGRLWFAKYWAIDSALGIRFLSASLKDSSGTSSVNANLLAINLVVGATYAFGGYKGVGRTYAEVLKPGSVSQQPAPSASTPGLPATSGTTQTAPAQQLPLTTPVKRGAVR